MTVDAGEPATELTPTPGSTECTTSTETGLRTCLPVTPAELVLGVAAPPEAAPPAVKAAIAAANRIRTLPYIWGGGHARWSSPGYDCSGAVSFALHGAGLIDDPDGLRRNDELGRAGQRAMDHDLRERRPRVRGDRRAPLGHRRRHRRDRAALASGNGVDEGLRRAAPGRLLEPPLRLRVDLAA